MKILNSKSASLILSDGTFYEGIGFGHTGTVFGEVVFNTGMTGYQEVLTDPSYSGQLITFTYPEIGNTGINLQDNESISPQVKGVVLRELSPRPSNWRSNESLESWLEKHNVVGILGIDTRSLVKRLRDSGSMNGVISNEDQFSPNQLFEKLLKVPSMEGLNLAKEVTTKFPYSWNSLCKVDFDQRILYKTKKKYKVVAIDFGIKKSILERLSAYGCEIQILPAGSDISKVLEYSPDGVFLSNGPGDPAAVTEGISLTKDLIKQKDLPIFGICLGHQIIGLALGAKTFKLPYGHRGLNHPCGTKGKVEITSQNHGFAIEAASLPSNIAAVTHLNLNDKTVAGIELLHQPVFGVQYHPEASPGPHDADHHFSRFVALMEERC